MNRPAENVVYGDWGSAAVLDIDLERSILGIILINNQTFPEVGSFLLPDHFASPVHGRIYEVIAWKIGRGEEANPITLRSFFANDADVDKLGGPDYLAHLAANMANSVGLADYGRTLVDLWQRRRVITVLRDCLADAQMPDPDRTGAEVIADTMSQLEAMGRGGPFQFKTAREIRIQAVEDMKVDLPCTTSGYARLDKAMGGGLYAGKMYGIIARKKAGKTLIGSAIGYAASLERPDSNILYIAGEMGAAGIEQRRWAAEMRVNALKFLNRDSRANPNFIGTAAEYAVNAVENLLYAHLPGLTFDRLRRALATFVMQYPNARGVVLDYLQLVKGRFRDENGADFADRVSQWIADFCAERGIWAVVLAQENQTGNVRGGEGLRLACDMCFELCRTPDHNGIDGEGNEAWLHMIETRYTPWMDVGSEKDPALRLVTQSGPFYEEIPPMPDQPETEEMF